MQNRAGNTGLKGRPEPLAARLLTTNRSTLTVAEYTVYTGILGILQANAVDLTSCRPESMTRQAACTESLVQKKAFVSPCVSCANSVKPDSAHAIGVCAGDTLRAVTFGAANRDIPRRLTVRASVPERGNTIASERDSSAKCPRIEFERSICVGGAAEFCTVGLAGLFTATERIGMLLAGAHGGMGRAKRLSCVESCKLE